MTEEEGKLHSALPASCVTEYLTIRYPLHIREPARRETGVPDAITINTSDITKWTAVDKSCHVKKRSKDNIFLPLPSLAPYLGKQPLYSTPKNPPSPTNN